MKERFGFLLVGIYTWITAVFLGGTWLDKVYANQLNGVLGASESALVFSEVSDTLLYIGFVMVIFAIGAIAVSWQYGAARNLFIASLLVLSLELIIPLLSTLTKNTQDLSWARLLPSGIASILAFTGMYKYYRQ
jgi:thiol:disulfide interchange protein